MAFVINGDNLCFVQTSKGDLIIQVLAMEKKKLSDVLIRKSIRKSIGINEQTVAIHMNQDQICQVKRRFAK